MQSCDDHESALCPALRSNAKGHDSHRSAILNAGVIFNRFAERSLLSALIDSSPARSSPRVLAPHALPLFLLAGSAMEVPVGFPHERLCGRRKLLTNSEIPRERLFGQRKKGRVGKARNDVERSCDKTWAILTPRSAHLAMKNAGASIRIGRLGKCDAH